MARMSEEEHQLFREQFKKTRLCRFNLKGACNKGDACRFAHGFGELQEQPDLTKTTLCKQWCRGKCTLSAACCPFAHGKRELHFTPLFAKHLLKQGPPQHDPPQFMRAAKAQPTVAAYPEQVDPVKPTPPNHRAGTFPRERLAGGAAVAAPRARSQTSKGPRPRGLPLLPDPADLEPAKVEIPTTWLAAKLQGEPMVLVPLPAAVAAAIMGEGAEGAAGAGCAHFAGLNLAAKQPLQILVS